MKRFKNRTIALILASTIAVAGAFGTENYKNTIKSLEFRNGESGNINMMMYTQTSFAGSLNLMKRDASTYVIMLPDVNSDMTNPPKLSQNIQNVDIKTMPYTPSGKGYTKITIKTAPNIQLTAKPAIYIETPKNTEFLIDENKENSTLSSSDSDNTQNNTELSGQPTEVNNLSLIQNNNKLENNSKNKDFEMNNSQNQATSSTPSDLNNTSNDKVTKKQSAEIPRTITGTEIFMILAGIVLFISLVSYFFIKSKAKMTEMLGEQINVDFDDDEENKNNKSKNTKKNIKETINNLDKMYTNSYTNSLPNNSQATDLDKNSAKTKQVESETLETENDVIVDLDELFKETAENKESEEKEEENSDLDDFLKNFEFDDGASEREKEVDLANLINTELYEKFINNNNLRFSQDDIEKIEKLLNSEISEEAMQSLMSVPIAPIKPTLTTQQRFEDIITTLSIDRQIRFSETDIASIKKIMNVELDNDFVTDLRTNPIRTEAVKKEINDRTYGPAHNVSEIITLKVKDMLPNLSEELKKYDGKEIKSEAKPDIVYYSEGFEVSTISVKDELPDLEKEKNNDNARQYRPSDQVDIALSGYDVSTINVSTMLPDLDDVVTHPEKYKEAPKEEKKVDEEALLNSISNVTFKPFFDNNREIEILNKFDDEENKDSVEDKKEKKEEKKEDVNKIVFAEKATQVAAVEPKVEKNTQNIAKNIEQKQICLVENKTYNIISTAEFDENLGCYLAQNGNEFAVIGYMNNKTFIVKTYEELKSKRIHARVNETFEDGTKQYLVKIGLSKFVLNVGLDSMNWVMDLC